MNFYDKKVTRLEDKEIFVFGSNPEGRHGRGAAKLALDLFGAIYGKGRGLQGQSYALPTKNLKAGYKEKDTGYVYELSGEKSISKKHIENNIKELYEVCEKMKDYKFYVGYTNDNNNLNGYSSREIFILFNKNLTLPDNIYFHSSFENIYNELFIL